QPSSHACFHLALPPPLDAGHVTIAPAIQHVGDQYDTLLNDYVTAVQFLPTQRTRAEVRARARRWLRMRQKPTRAPAVARDPTLHPGVQRAIEIVELHLSRPIRIRWLALQVGLPHNHLTRLFRSALGTTVVGYVRRR